MEDERKKKSGCLKRFIVIFLIASALIYAYIEYGGISFNDPLVRAVQLSSPPGETVRFEKAFRNFFADGTWESILATDGNNYVNFSGKAFYGDTIEVFDLQFFIGEEKGVDFWKLSAIEVSGEPKHPGLFGNDLLEKIYEEYK